MSKYLCYFPSSDTVKVLYFDSICLIIKYFLNNSDHPIHVFELDEVTSLYKFLTLVEKVD